MHMKQIDPIATLGAIIFIIIVGAGFSRPGRGNRAPTDKDIIPIDIQVQPGTLSELALTGRLSLQYASQEALEALPGIGAKKAERIIRWRERHEG